MRSLLYSRGSPIMVLRSQPARLFLPAAVLIALHPTVSSSLAFVTPRHHSKLWPSPPPVLARENDELFSRRIPLWPRRPRWAPTSLALSTSSNSSTHHGSSAYRSQKPLPTDSDRLQLLSFYRFVPISRPESVRDALFERMRLIPGLRGTVYVAEEGINAQFAVPVGEPLDQLLQAFRNEGSNDDEDGGGGCLPFDAFEDNPPNMGDVVGSEKPTFDRFIVRTRDYILRDGMNPNDDDQGEVPSLDWSDAGTELAPSEWDEQLRQQPKNIQLLDCRNGYESDQGSFLSARPLNTQTFADTWPVLDSQVESQSLDPSEPVYIFCTGGIRCVKVGAYLRQHLGFDDVRSLRHGIVGYERWKGENSEADDVGEGESLWVGENFLFDKRRFAKKDTDDSKSKS